MVFRKSTDKDWERFGRDDPYFGVITHDKFHRKNLTDESKIEFFESGERDIARKLAVVKEMVDNEFIVERALDFWCGVGRIVIPLARRAKKVTGVDVSDSMLREVKVNCANLGLDNVSLVKSDDGLSRLTGQYNFIHSSIVFQHIPIARGERIFSRLLDYLSDDGVCVLHFTYGKDYARRSLVSLIKRRIPLARNFINLIKGRSFFHPSMQMNPYDINRLFKIMQRAGVSNFYSEFTDHGGELGIVFYF